MSKEHNDHRKKYHVPFNGYRVHTVRDVAERYFGDYLIGVEQNFETRTFDIELRGSIKKDKVDTPIDMADVERFRKMWAKEPDRRWVVDVFSKQKEALKSS